MPVFEYKVVPAPAKGLKGKGLKGTRERFANALQSVMNEHGAQGWEYVRADMLPCEERSGLTGSNVVYQNMLVFRRITGGEEVVSFTPPVRASAPQPVVAPVAVAAVTEPTPVATPDTDVETPEATREAPAPEAAKDDPKASDLSAEDAAAAAAAAALSAYRHQGKGAPRIGPATQD